jgi:hypothetical protein
MSFLRHGQIYQSDGFLVCAQGEASCGFAPKRPIVLMSLRPAIPWRVALLHCPPPLHRPESIVNQTAETINHHLPGAGEFSTGDLGNFQPALTSAPAALVASIEHSTEIVGTFDQSTPAFLVNLTLHSYLPSLKAGRQPRLLRVLRALRVRFPSAIRVYTHLPV